MAKMRWEELSAREFPRAVRAAGGVCVVPLGCLEKHGGHLPLGTDLFQIRAIAEAAVAREPAVIFPPYFMTQIQCAKHCPGTLALPGRLISDLLDGVCEEIGRNGLDKIILLNGHGGNEAWLAYTSWMMAHERPRPFTVYVARLNDFWIDSKTPRYGKLAKGGVDGHAGEAETSLMLAIRPELVRISACEAPGKPLGRLKHLPVYSPHGWYADYPRHYAGDGRDGTEEKGRAKLADCAANVAAIIRAVKRDRVAPGLKVEFMARTFHGKTGLRRPR